MAWELFRFKGQTCPKLILHIKDLSYLNTAACSLFPGKTLPRRVNFYYDKKSGAIGIEPEESGLYILTEHQKKKNCVFNMRSFCKYFGLIDGHYSCAWSEIDQILVATPEKKKVQDEG